MAIRDEFLIQRQGKTFVVYAGLLEEAHNIGLKSIETELLSKVLDEQYRPLFADFKAMVTMEDGSVYTGYGDASRDSVGKMIHSHLIRMAETRAKARALRDAINVGVTALEELGGDDATNTESSASPSADQRSSDQAASPESEASRSREQGAQPETQSNTKGPRRPVTNSQAAKIEWLAKQNKYKVPDLSRYDETSARDLIDWLEEEKQKKEAS